MSKLSNEDLGLVGEDEFRRICTRYGVKWNTPESDVRGWDFYLEFPDPEVTSLSLGTAHLSASNQQCKVQVKSTYKEHGNRALTLSTLRMITTDSLPAFIVFLEFDNKTNLQKMYITHITRDLTYRILQKCKECEVKKKSISKSKLTIRKDERTQINIGEDSSLKTYLKNQIGSIEQYKARKISMLAKVGYEEGHISGNVTISKKDIDRGISEKDWIEIKDFSLSDIRFGVKSEEFGPKDGQLFIAGREAKREGEVALYSGELAQPIIFESTLLTNTLYAVTGPNDGVMTIENELFVIKITKGNGNDDKLDFNLKTDSKINASTLVRVLRFLAATQTESQQSKVELRFTETPWGCHLQSSKVPEEEVLHFVSLVSSLRRHLVDYVEFEDVLISINDLYDQQRYFENLVSAMEIDLSTNGVVVQCPESEWQKHTHGCGIVVIVTPIGSSCIATFLTFRSEELVEVDNGYHMKNAIKNHESSCIIDDMNESAATTLNNELERLSEKYSSKGYYIFKDTEQLKAFNTK